MQGNDSGVCCSNPGKEWWGLYHGNSSSRDWRRSCSEYILEVGSPGFTFGMWGIEKARSQILLFFFFFFLNNWSVTSNLLMGETAERTGFLGRIRCLGWDLVGLRCLSDIEEDVSGRQVDT